MADFSDDRKVSAVREVLRLIGDLYPNTNDQLTILTVAIVALCRQRKISKLEAMPVIADCFDEETLLSAARILSS